MYDELPPVMGRTGREKIGLLSLSFLQAAGLMVGLMLGYSLGPALFGPGVPATVFAAACAFSGGYITGERHGVLRLQRAALRVQFWQRAFVGQTQLDGWALVDAPEQGEVELDVEIVDASGQALYGRIREEL
jgi:hypothetical protein